jgi:hypothetical protein
MIAVLHVSAMRRETLQVVDSTVCELQVLVGVGRYASGRYASLSTSNRC